MTGAPLEDRAIILAALSSQLIAQGRLYDELLGLHERGTPAGDLRDRALRSARDIAVTERVVWVQMLNPESNLAAGLAPRFSPVGALGALQRLGYAFAGLADEDAPKGILLSRAELSGLIEQYHLEDWMEITRPPGARP